MGKRQRCSKRSNENPLIVEEVIQDQSDDEKNKYPITGKYKGYGWYWPVLLHGRDSGRALNDLKARLHPLIEGEAGLAADCVRIIEEKVEAHPDAQERMLCLVGRAGALYPFYRTSSLLRHVAGKTHNVPVVLLYPGTRAGQTGLSFMGQVEPDHDYRPRIYP